MSWKVHETDEVFAALRCLCSNSYRMYDPSEHRHYYDHDCETYECAVEDAEREYGRLLKHCNHQREQLAKRSGSQTIDILMELLNEYRESECAIAEDRVTWYADRLDGRTEDERMEERTRTEQNGAITDELREYVDQKDGWGMTHTHAKAIAAIADRIDERHAEELERMWDEAEGADLKAFEATHVKLPVDADGMPIRAGDLMEERSGHTFEVASLMAFGGSDNWLVLSDARNFSSFREPHDLRHHREPTVEDVLREMLKHFGAIEEVTPEVSEYIAEYAAKLRLAGDAK